MLLDWARTWANVRCSVGWSCESWNTVPARLSVLGTVTGVSGVATPSSSAAAAVITLPVEPGS